MAANEVFALVGRIALEGVDAVQSALRAVEERAERAGDNMQKWGKRTADVGQATASLFGKATLVLGGILAGTVKVAADFEQQMSNVKSVMSSAEVEQFGGALEDLAIQMGEKTKYSALEAAQGIEELIKAGVATEDIIRGGLEGALNLATAGELELGEAAQIASTALNAFRDDNLTVIEAADLLAGAANASATDVRELQFGLSQVAAVAAGVNLSFADTSTALAVFAQNGLKGSDAGTSLKTMLLNLQPTTKRQIELFDELGITTEDGTNKFYDANGQLKGFAEVSQILQDSLGGMTDQQRSAALQTMFGTDAIRAANIMYKEGAEGVNNMYNEMSKVTAAEVAAEKMDNLKGKFEEFMGGVETAAISIGTIFIPALTTLTGYITKGVEWFNNLSEGQMKLIAVFAAVTLGVFALMTGLGILLMIIGNVAVGVGVLMSASLSVVAPIVAVVAAVGLLVAALVAAYMKSETFREMINSVFSTLAGIVQKGLMAAWGFIQSIWGQIQAFWAENGAMILAAVKNVFNFLEPIIRLAMNLVIGTIVMYWNIAKTIFQGALNIIMGLVKFFAALFTGEWGALWESVKQILTGMLQVLWGVIQVVLMSTIFGIFKRFGGAVSGYIGGFVTKIVGYFRSLGTGATTAINNLRNAVVSRIDDLVINVALKISQMSSKLANTFLNIVVGAKNAFNNVKNAIVTPIQAASKLVTDAVNKIKSLFNTLKLKMPKIQMPPLPHFEIKGKFSLSPPSVPKLGVNWYAQGGVFDGASVIGVGEQPGVKEAVIPLSGNNMLPFARAIAALMPGGGGGDTFHVNIDPKNIREFNDLIRILNDFRQSVRKGGGGYGTDPIL